MSFSCAASSIQVPSSFCNIRILFLFLLTIVDKWKNLVFLSPMRNQSTRDFCIHKTSSCIRTSDQGLLSFASSFNKPTVALPSSALETPSNLFLNLCLRQKMLPKVSLFQPRSLTARLFNEVVRSPVHYQDL